MSEALVWLLIMTGGHGYFTVPGISTQQECERLYRVLYEARWGGVTPFGEGHRCVAYRVRPVSDKGER
jgi:hypothetical protein